MSDNRNINSVKKADHLDPLYLHHQLVQKGLMNLVPALDDPNFGSVKVLFSILEEK
jgi:hypothetical protein